MPETKGNVLRKATFGAGCFWHVEHTYMKLNGVEDTSVGFMGGTKKQPTYKQVCTGRTGHAEVVHLEYDPKKISYEDLLDVFWAIHDPTTKNRHGLNIGTQYRSVIFYHDQSQRKKAIGSRKALQSTMEKKIVTQIRKAGEFYIAEDYHQKYYQRNKKRVCGLF